MKKIDTSYRLQSEKYEFLKLFMNPGEIDIFMDEVKKLAKKTKKSEKKWKKVKKLLILCWLLYNYILLYIHKASKETHYETIWNKQRISNTLSMWS